MFAHIFSHTIRLLTSLVLATAALVLAPSMAWAQSPCTGLFAIYDDDASAATLPTSLAYLNTSTNLWVRLGSLSQLGQPAPAIQYNALAQSPVSGLLYYVDRTNYGLRVINLNQPTATQPFTETFLGTIPSAPTGGILGATFDPAGNMYVMATSGTIDYLSRLTFSTTTSFTVTAPFTTISYSTGVTPTVGNSGDLYCTAAGACYLVTNAPAGILRYDLTTTPGPSFANVASPSTAITGIAAGTSIGGAGIDPATGVLYIGAATTYSVNATFAATAVTSNLLVTDMASCPTPPPARPTISKTINPPYSAASPGTATVVINIVNSNTNPVFLNSAFVDVLPAGMVVASPLVLSSTCSSVMGTPTAVVGGNAVTFAAGGRIPASPGCSITFNVSATAAVSAYTNTLAIGSLVSTVGSNLATATAVFKVGTDFSAVKSQCAGICGVTTTSTLSTYGNQTHQYVLTITNSTVGGTGTVSFTDTLPNLMTPVLSITAAATGGGTCTTASAVVGTATQITGVFGNAPAGAQCNITVTALVNPQAVGITVTNTLTMAPVTGTSDTNATNNTAAVLTTVGPSTVLTVTKTNGVTSLLAGSTTSYTVTVANLGPANAPNSVVKDPAVVGLSCTTVTCSPGNIVGTASCPGTLDIPSLQGAGLVIPVFNTGSSVTFVVNCDVTATGQ
jgi:trimeric autotransporter adhesin